METRSMYVFCDRCQRHVLRKTYAQHYNQRHEPQGRKVITRYDSEYHAVPTAFDRR